MKPRIEVVFWQHMKCNVMFLNAEEANVRNEKIRCAYKVPIGEWLYGKIHF